VDPYITHNMTHEQINTAFDLLHAGESIRSVIHFQPQETLLVNTLPGKIVPAWRRTYVCKVLKPWRSAVMALRIAP
ncbi:hypothetical protein, partial [Stenotrophomonas sp. GbtcB23]|uniref:hypothetical protein n=1 Tax=Stenotrophomonas sp. GbtcB23 TaxID=2824768 RepID=UPI001C310E58